MKMTYGGQPLAFDAMRDALLVRAGVRDQNDAAIHPQAVHLVEDHAPLLRQFVASYGIGQRGIGPDSSDGAIFAAGLTSADFAQTLSGLCASIAAAGMAPHAGYLKLCHLADLENYRPTNFPALDFDVGLREVGPGAEATNFRLIERAGLSGQLRTWGLNIDIARQVFLNDDVELITAVMRAIGESAAQAEASRLYTLIESNPTMKDGQPMFVTANTVADPLDATTLGSAMAALRNTLTPRGVQGNYAPKVLLVAPSIEMVGRKLLHESGSVDVELVVSPQLAAGRWYLGSDANIAPAVTLAHLKGAGPGPRVGPRSQRATTTDSLQTAVRHDFEVVAVSRALVRGG